jgi:hypothetical protein
VADQRDAWSEDISDRVLLLESQVKRLKWATVALTVIAVFQLSKDHDLPLALRTTLLVGLLVSAVVVVALKLLERWFPPK